MRGEGSKISVFVHPQGIKTVHTGEGGGGGSKNDKILSTQLNDPQIKISVRVGLSVGTSIIDMIKGRGNPFIIGSIYHRSKLMMKMLVCNRFAICYPRKNPKYSSVKFIYSEKATKLCEIFTLLLTTVQLIQLHQKLTSNCLLIQLNLPVFTNT